MTDVFQPLQDFINDVNARLVRIEARLGLLEIDAAERQTDTASTELPPMLAVYDEFEAHCLPPFIVVSTKLGDDFKILAALTEKAFATQRAFLVMASRCRKPEVVSAELVKELQQCVVEVKAMRDCRSELLNHVNMVREGIEALGWVCVERTPRPFVESFIEGIDYWGNRIRVQFKASDPDQVEFVVTFKELFVQLEAYIKAHHLTGVAWNSKGIDSALYVSRSSSS